MDSIQNLAGVSHLAQLFLIPLHFFASWACEFLAVQELSDTETAAEEVVFVNGDGHRQSPSAVNPHSVGEMFVEHYSVLLRVSDLFVSLSFQLSVPQSVTEMPCSAKTPLFFLWKIQLAGGSDGF